MNDIQKLLPEYNLYQLFVRPEDAGHSAVNRLRTYVYCAHKETCEYLFDVFETYNAVTEAIKEVTQTRCRDYFVSNQRQREVHSWNICRKRTIPWRPVSCPMLNRFSRFC